MRYLPQFVFLSRYVTIKRVFKDFKLDFGDFVNEFPDLEIFYKINLGKLSGGAKRIVEIYAILTSKTKFCILDELFSQVMPLHVDTIKELILREKENKGIIITDHLYKYTIDISDDLYVINNGKTYYLGCLGNAKMDSRKEKRGYSKSLYYNSF